MNELDDELEIELRDADDIGSRIVLLTALAIWPDHETLEDRDNWVEWLGKQGVVSQATRPELVVLNDHRERELAESDLDVCGRAFDSLQALCWSAGLVDEIRLVIEDDGSSDMMDRIPIPNEKVEPFLDGLIVRDENDIALERERSELWNWRLAAELSRRRTSGPLRRELDEAISEVVLESAAAMVIPENDGSDFLIGGATVRSLDDDTINTLLVASEEHLRALNWVCGLTEWNEIHLPD